MLHLVRWAPALAVLLFAAITRAEPPPPALVSPAMVPQPSMAGAQDQALARALVARRQRQVAQHIALGKRLFDKRQYVQSSRQYSVAFTFEARFEILIEIARAYRRAELDTEALTIYERLQQEQPQSPWREEIEDELKTLHAKIEDPEMSITQMLRERIDLAKKSFQSGLFTVASQEYSMAYAIRPLSRLLFNTAQAYRRAGQPDEAYILYSRFLDEEPQTPLKKETVGYLKELRAVAFQPPLHKRAWFWSVVGTAAAGLVASLTAVVITQPWVPRVSFE